VNALDVAAALACVAGAALAALRWLRVAQREHYLPGAASRFALRWWLGFGPNRVLAAAAIVAVALSPVSSVTALAGGAAVAIGPFGMSLLGRSPGPIVWTRRLRTLAGVTVVLIVVPVVLAAAVSASGRAAVPVAALVALLTPALVDVAAAVLAPLEDQLASRHVAAARATLARVKPVVVGITGSYGKTSTKNYVAHLCAPALCVVASPASFNNRAGLSRAVNELLVPGTEVFIAEMGTYGPGEIAALCEWCSPRVAAITAIGPVHLERFGSEDAVVRAKAEILEPAEVAVLNVDDPRLAALADQQERRGLRVWRCSAAAGADISAVREGDSVVVSVGGAELGRSDTPGAQPGNIAVAVAIALELGVERGVVGERLATLPSVASRQALTTLSTGATAIDDTFNSNPAGCRAALAVLERIAQPGGKRVVVTPGMVELGPRQQEENATFATAAAAVATHVAVVGWTNRRALLRGLQAAGAKAAVILVDTRDQAVAWVRQHTGPGDAVLYENDVPDHYP
jgi:UDP-N-acetylmuramoyl-tripeptide--D-alanyl-D-alanine ligase